jgi:hypothetical protein
MNYSRWATENKHRLGAYAGKKIDEKAVDMNDAQRTRAVAGLVGKAKVNRGEQSDEQRNRANAIAVLAGKREQDKPVRPGVNELLGRG